MQTLRWFNVALRGLMELGIVIAFGYWGWSAGATSATKIALGAAAPLVMFGIWGAVDFRKAGKAAEPLRLVEELVISGLAALALASAGQRALAWILAAIPVVHHALVVACGDTLLKRR